MTWTCSSFCSFSWDTEPWVFLPRLPYVSCSPVSSPGTRSRGSWWSCLAPCISGQPAASPGRPPWFLQHKHTTCPLSFKESRSSNTAEVRTSCFKTSIAWTGTWTLDPQIKSLMLYRLSYPGSEGEVSSAKKKIHKLKCDMLRLHQCLSVLFTVMVSDNPPTGVLLPY